ncbi:alpha/beta fold hydrolase [Streptomyces sp. NPDC002764]|uniref:alpha/beta fold hydrolase n=1 Tax=Streptomyces sp. NPDC002764 TaxID=3154428 RepID=UPI003319243A
MSADSTPVLFLHGFWHGSWCWSEVATRVAGTGRTTVAVDMAGHGLRARRPRCLTERPFPPESLATEVSPVADVDLDQAGDLLLSQIKEVGRGGPVTVVAHSMGGTVLTRVAQIAPDLVAHAVYVAAFMPGSGIPAVAYVQLPENAGELVGPSLRADPAVVGALRLDLASDDPAYRAQLREMLYGDVTEAVADAALALMTPDAPAAIPLGTTTLTPDGWGSVPRTYITCSKDMALRPALQRKFISDTDAFPGNPTSVVELDASHSPFLSMPRQVADVVGQLGRRTSSMC